MQKYHIVTRFFELNVCFSINVGHQEKIITLSLGKIIVHYKTF